METVNPEDRKIRTIARSASAASRSSSSAWHCSPQVRCYAVSRLTCSPRCCCSAFCKGSAAAHGAGIAVDPRRCVSAGKARSGFCAVRHSRGRGAGGRAYAWAAGSPIIFPGSGVSSLTGLSGGRLGRLPPRRRHRRAPARCDRGRLSRRRSPRRSRAAGSGARAH
jgi:hypothetical protein